MKFGIDHTKKVSILSGGMKRRVAIVRALLHDADLYIFDEPFKGLDENNKQLVMNEIKSLKKTTIIITHNYSEVEYFGLQEKIISEKFALYK